MPAPLEGHDGLLPEQAHDLDLLLEATPSVVEVHAKRLVLDVVPADPETQTKLPAGQDVDLGNLLGQQAGLALRRDHDARDELELRRDRRQIAEKDQDLVEHVLGPVRPGQMRVRSGIGTEDVVVGVQMVEAELLDRLRIRANAGRIRPHLSLRKDGPDPHQPRSTREPPTSASRPSAKRTHALPLPS